MLMRIAILGIRNLTVLLGKGGGAGAELQLSSNAEIAEIGTNRQGLGGDAVPTAEGA